MEQNNNKDIEFWRSRAITYEWMFLEQKDITAGYRKLIEEMQQELKELKTKISNSNL